jgi:hypothetical protein
MAESKHIKLTLARGAAQLRKVSAVYYFLIVGAGYEITDRVVSY